jgi:cytochrome c peroxidase
MQRHVRSHRRSGVGVAPRRAVVATLGAAIFSLLVLPGSGAGQPRAATLDAIGTSAPFTEEERARILSLGPWPPAPLRDTANVASGTPGGIAFGELLFHSARLSDAGGVRCASCHEPWRDFTDGRAQALGRSPGTRNTPTLLNVAGHRHFGWDGANDQLWRQSLRPLQDAREMPASAAHVGALVRLDPALRARYEATFGSAPGADDERVLRDVGRALAAYAETLASPRSPFDDWRDALAASARGREPSASTSFPPAALRGLRLFVGRAGCVACHGGPAFGDDDFHVSLVHSLGPDAAPDAGRAAGPSNAFRTPGLREAAATAPYMHDGSVARLCDAVKPHAVDPASPALPQPVSAATDRRDLVAFLRTLAAHPMAADEAASRACDTR